MPQLANASKPTGDAEPAPEVIHAKSILQAINDLSGVDDHTDGIPAPPNVRESLPTVHATRANASLSHMGSQLTSSDVLQEK